MLSIRSSKEQLNALLFDVVRESQDGFSIFDQDHMLIFCNDRFAGHFGLSVEQTEGLTFTEILRKSYLSGDGLYIENGDIEGFITKVSMDFEDVSFKAFEHLTVDGSWIRVSRFINSDGFIFLYSTDITNFKNTESQLRLALSDVEKLASTDLLTGISNRRHFFELAEIEFERSRRYEHRLSLLALDIDYFKRINDNYGHRTGDQVLLALTECCRKLLRSSDIFSRQGGEEFLILLPETELVDASLLAERIRQAVSELRVSYGDDVISLTTSIGLSELSDNTETLDQLMNHADKALYRAKEAGRNRSEIWF
ncbi:sensor domain-containing diguanylate cyclase [Psychromonas aquimarina]|uniref:sensor domain-containing diguanylate cyclase n=1 Tax=Psychromonas aquimarina TaxID=444919 RepID=UPI000416AACF|nr:sensor domain-containing diguanylate cyclase [Psychromonas aquimarina]